MLHNQFFYSFQWLYFGRITAYKIKVFKVRRTRVKVCGITSLDDALSAIHNGVDAIGLNFWNKSSRAVSIEQAQEICRKLPVFVSIVALVVNAEKQFVEQLIADIPVNLLQFHGDESPDFCEQFGVPYVKVLRMHSEINLDLEFAKYSKANSILLDAYRKGTPGGTGESFDWERIPKKFRKDITLAGGLREDNVAQAIGKLRPYAVDVCGGVESSPGVKDNAKMQRFISAVQNADRSEYS